MTGTPRDFTEAICPHCGGKIGLATENGAAVISCFRLGTRNPIISRCDSVFFGVRCLLDPGHVGDHIGTRLGKWKA